MAVRLRWGIRSGRAAREILVTLLYELKRRGGKRGIASACLGGGEAVAVAVERE